MGDGGVSNTMSKVRWRRPSIGDAVADDDSTGVKLQSTKIGGEHGSDMR